MRNIFLLFTLLSSANLLSACGNWSANKEESMNMNSSAKQLEEQKKDIQIVSKAGNMLTLERDGNYDDYQYGGTAEFEITNNSPEEIVVGLNTALPEVAYLLKEQILELPATSQISIAPYSIGTLSLRVRVTGTVTYVPSTNYFKIGIAVASPSLNSSSSMKLYIATE